MCYLLKEKEFIDSMNMNVSQLLKTTKSHLHTMADDVLVIRSPEKRCDKGQTNLKRMNITKKKHPYTGRFGFKAEMMRQYYRAKVILNNDEEENKSQNEVIVSKVKEGKKERLHSHLITKEIEMQLNSDVQLCDNTINLAMGLLAERFPDIQGFESTSQLSKFSRHGTNFVQILHNGSNHWVTVASKRENEVYIYDSSKTKDLPVEIAKQIAQLCSSKDRSIRVIRAEVQQQTDTISCGLFAIAFAFDVCAESDPRNVHYDQAKMRSHLLKCIKENCIAKFPRSQKRLSSKCKNSITFLDVYCVCRQIYDADEVENDQGNSWQCAIHVESGFTSVA